jgi:putative endonuclease
VIRVAAPIDRRQIGLNAEQRAVQYLRTAGLQIVQRNYACRMGEIDIVARHGTTLAIVEVQLRSTQRYGGAAASITRAKRRRLVLATRHLLARYPMLQRMPVRFDAVLVPPGDGAIEWLRGAFDA